jgi:hypothetical protein
MTRSIAASRRCQGAPLMDEAQFDALTQRLTATLSRRRSLSLLALLGLHQVTPVPETAAKKHCPPCKKRKRGKCTGRKPDGTACGGLKACHHGRCQCPNGMKPCSNGDCIAKELCCPGPARICGPGVRIDVCGASQRCRCQDNLAGSTMCGSANGACGCTQDADCAAFRPGAFCGNAEGCGCPPGMGLCMTPCED